MTLRQNIIAEARKYLGVKYEYRGRSAAGLDCAGLLYVVFNALIEVGSDFQDYPLYPKSAKVFANIRHYAQRIKKSDAGAGDLVLMNFSGCSSHFGIITDTGVIHSDTDIGKVIEHALPDKNVLGGRRIAHFRMKGVPVWQN